MTNSPARSGFLHSRKVNKGCWRPRLQACFHHVLSLGNSTMQLHIPRAEP